MSPDLYFAYGSNMSTVRLQARIPHAAPVGRACWPGMELMFNKVGRDGTGKANLVVQEKTCAWGVVFELGAADWDVLDRFEPGYARRSCQVILDSGKLLSTQVYLGIEPIRALPPLDVYRDHLIRGAREHGLPDDVMARIQTLERR